MKRVLPYASVLLSMLIWGGSGIAIKRALTDISPFTLVTLRFLLAVTLMLCIGLLFRRFRPQGPFALQKIAKRDIPLLATAGFVQPFLYYILETYAYRAIGSPTIAEVLLSTSPLLAPVFAFVLLRERVTMRQLCGIAVSTGGVLLMMLTGNAGLTPDSGWGVVLCFGAVSTAVLYTVLLRKIPSRYNSLSVVFWVQGLSLLFFVPLWLCTDGAGSLRLLGEVSAGSLWAMGYLAAGSSVVAFICFCYSVREIGVTRANAFNNIRPVFTALFMLVLFGEILPLLKWAGIVLVLVGLRLTESGQQQTTGDS